MLPDLFIAASPQASCQRRREIIFVMLVLADQATDSVKIADQRTSTLSYFPSSESCPFV